MRLNKKVFENYLYSINQCYSADCAKYLPQIVDFSKDIFDGDDKIELKLLLDFESNQSNVYISSVVKRLVGITNIQQSRDKNVELDIKATWKLIAESILLIPSEHTISSVGSQGFLSIPLYKNDKIKEEFEFIRLHIWDNSLDKYINKQDCENFSIHTHAFFAKSWIIFGKVINNRYLVKELNTSSGKSLFKIGYNRTLNKVNQHTSTANNSGQNVNTIQISQEIHMANGTYEIKEGDFHQSGTANENGLSATFFSFTAKDGLLEESFVVGPSDRDISEINRKMRIDPTELLNKLDDQINKL